MKTTVKELPIMCPRCKQKTWYKKIGVCLVDDLYDERQREVERFLR